MSLLQPILPIQDKAVQMVKLNSELRFSKQSRQTLSTSILLLPTSHPNNAIAQHCAKPTAQIMELADLRCNS